MRKLTQEEVIKRFKDKHGDKYDYSLVIYINSTTSVIINCPQHGSFEQIPKSHLKGIGCKYCGIEKSSISLINTFKGKRNWDFYQPSEYKLIPLSNGKLVKVDNYDFNELKCYNWYLCVGYAENKQLGLMHRYIMSCPDDKVIDHINHDKLDNRKQNLRICTISQNGMNQFLQTVDKTSIYKGVYWDKSRNKWQSNIVLNKKRKYIGRFDCEIDAAKAYDKKAKELFGEFALTNF